MAEHRPFPPSARRLALARRAGLHAASPLVTAAAAALAALVAARALAGAAAARLATWIAGACGGAPDLAAGGGSPAPATAPHADLAAPAAAALAGAPHAVLSLALPVVLAAAAAAMVAHAAQARALWLPRRRVAGAPALDRGAAERARRAGVDLAGAALVGALAFAWLWSAAPSLAALPALPASVTGGGLAPAAVAAAALVVAAAAALAAAWALLGGLDALLRHAALARALRMSAHDKREDDRLAGADPRWRAARAKAARQGAAPPSLAGAAVLLLGDGVAVAIAWDPARRPVPTRVAAGRAARATQLLGLARRDRVPVHRDPALAAALAAAAAGPVPEAHWPRLAEIIAAVRRP